MKPILIALALAAAAPALAQDTGSTATIDIPAEEPYGFGMGAVLGEPTGLSFIYRPALSSAVQGHVSWSLVTDRARVNVDYLHTIARAHAPDANLTFPLYLGIGGVVGAFGDSPPDPEPFWLGARIPLGVAMLPSEVPIDVFAEVVPTLYVLPETAPGIEGAVGVRVYL